MSQAGYLISAAQRGRRVVRPWGRLERDLVMVYPPGIGRLDRASAAAFALLNPLRVSPFSLSILLACLASYIVFTIGLTRALGALPGSIAAWLCLLTAWLLIVRRTTPVLRSSRTVRRGEPGWESVVQVLDALDALTQKPHEAEVILNKLYDTMPDRPRI